MDQYTWDEIKDAASKTENMPARLDWLIEHYIDSHVLVVDPKYKTGKWEEFLSVFKGLENKIIFKAYGDTQWAFDPIRAKGVKTWGYLRRRQGQGLVRELGRGKDLRCSQHGVHCSAGYLDCAQSFGQTAGLTHSFCSRIRQNGLGQGGGRYDLLKSKGVRECVCVRGGWIDCSFVCC